MRHHYMWGWRSVSWRGRLACSAPKDRGLCRIVQTNLGENRFYDVGCIGATGIARGPLLCASKNPPRFREDLSSRQLGEWVPKGAYLLWLTSRVSSSQSNIR